VGRKVITPPTTPTIQIINKALLESSLPTISINISSAADRAWTNSLFLLGFTPHSGITLHSVSSRSCSHFALIWINQSLKENTGDENVNYTVSLVLGNSVGKERKGNDVRNIQLHIPFPHIVVNVSKLWSTQEKYSFIQILIRSLLLDCFTFLFSIDN